MAGSQLRRIPQGEARRGKGSELLFLQRVPFQLVRAFIVAVDETTTGSGLIEETLRTEAPVQGLPRVTTGNTELAGCPSPEGIPSAGRLCIGRSQLRAAQAGGRTPAQAQGDGPASHLRLWHPPPRGRDTFTHGHRGIDAPNFRSPGRADPRHEHEIPGYAPSMVILRLIELAIRFTKHRTRTPGSARNLGEE